jgi:hypothetical protein
MFKIKLDSFKKVIKVCKQKGILYTINISCSHLKSKLGIKKTNPIDKRRIILSEEINRLFDSTVRYGPFKGLKFSMDTWWGSADRASMLLGLYEQEVLESLANVPKKYNTFIDLGAADGYYSIGVLINKLFEHTFCFEISKKGQEIIHKNAELNGVRDKISIYGIAERTFYEKFTTELLSKSVLFVDIEGGEFEIFDKEVFSIFRNSIIFLELHDWFFEDGAEKLNRITTDASQYFNITKITTTSRNLSEFNELKNFGDTDRWLVCSEGRARLMTWYRLDPKSTES